MKIEWYGIIIGVQPRIRLTRSFDQRQDSYLGYILSVDGKIGDDFSQFTLGIGKGAQSKYKFQTGDKVRGLCESVANPHMEPSEYYKASKLTVISRGQPGPPPPWTDQADDLEVYRSRGHRRLNTTTYSKHCLSCKWGCRMAVEIIVDHWNPNQRKFRTETFCYGPKSCGFYKAGPTRKVPGRKGMTWEEEDWIDEQETEHRGLND